MRMGYFIIGDLKILTPPKSFKQNLIELEITLRDLDMLTFASAAEYAVSTVQKSASL